MTKNLKEYIKKNLPYYGSITRKYRFTNPIKDKAWSLLSDFVRCRDVIMYGRCVSSGKKITDYRTCDAGHFYSMGGHGALIGFDVLNVHAQSKNDNQLSSMHTGANFEKELKRRYGKKLLNELKEISHILVKADDLFFLNKIEEVWKLFKELKLEKPDFDYPEYL